MSGLRCECDGERGARFVWVDLPAAVAGKGRAKVAMDACMVREIEGLWGAGIRTTGCCCGHGSKDGYVGVHFDDIPKMKALGYVVRPNEMRPGDEDGFYPKTIDGRTVDRQTGMEVGR